MTSITEMKSLGARVGVRSIASMAGVLILAQLATATGLAHATGGTSWVLRPAPSPYWGTGVTFAEGTFVAVGNEPTVLTSPDGVTWTANPAPQGNWTSVVYGQGQFVAVAANSVYGNLAMTSPTASRGPRSRA